MRECGWWIGHPLSCRMHTPLGARREQPNRLTSAEYKARSAVRVRYKVESSRPSTSGMQQSMTEHAIGTFCPLATNGVDDAACHPPPQPVHPVSAAACFAAWPSAPRAPKDRCFQGGCQLPILTLGNRSAKHHLPVATVLLFEAVFLYGAE